MSDKTKVPYESLTRWGHGPMEESDYWSGDFNSREDAIRDGECTYDGEFWVISGTCPSPGQFFRVDRWLELAEESANDEFVDCDDNVLNFSNSAMEELKEFVSIWAEKHVSVNAWETTGKPEFIVGPEKTDDEHE